jgi:hypothetical protein
MPDPERVLRQFGDQFLRKENHLRDILFTTDWPKTSKMDGCEYLIAQDIIGTTLGLIDRIDAGDFRRISAEPWSWNGLQSDHQIQSLMAQLVFSSFVTDGPNLFYSRWIARLGSDLLALVPGATKIGDIVSMPVKNIYPVPLVFHDVAGEIDGSLDEEIWQRIYQTPSEDISMVAANNLNELKGGGDIEHFTVIGECFVEGMMHNTRSALEREGPVQILALH